MNGRKVADFIKHFDAISALMASKEDDLNLPLLVKLESQLTLTQELNVLLQAPASSTRQAAELIADFLRSRWIDIYQVVHKHFDISGSDAMPTHSPNSMINRVSAILAHVASSSLDKLTYEVLMPSVHAAECYYPNQNKLTALPFRRFVFSSEGHVIDILQCLDEAAAAQSKRLYNTVEGLTTKTLSEFEESLVVNHSVSTRAYYDAIVKAISSQDTAALYAAKERFHASLKDDEYRVQVSYGDVGKRRLANRIFKLARISTWDDLLRFAESNQINDKDLMSEFICYLDAKHLFGLFVPFQQELTITKSKNYAGYTHENLARIKKHIEDELSKTRDEKKFTVLLSCCLESYYLEREMDSTFKTNRIYSTFFSGMAGEFTRGEKLLATRVLQRYLCDLNNGESLLNFVKAHMSSHQHLYQHDPNRIYDAYNNGELGKLVLRVKGVVSQRAKKLVGLNN